MATEEYKVQQVISLLKAGVSQRHIFIRTGVPEKTVRNIKKRYKVVVPPKPKKKKQPSSNPRGTYKIREQVDVLSRCPICGAKVQMPCLACKLRKDMKKKKLVNKLIKENNVTHA